MMNIDQIVRTQRKSFALIVQRDGSLVVRAPLRASDRQIRELVQKKEKWIIAKQEAARRTYATMQPREYVNGEGFLYLGKSYKLAIVDRNQPPLTFGDQFYLAKSALPNAEAVFKAWYTQQARQIISERAGWYAARSGFVYQRINLTGARTRWGSCGRRGSLNFTWRLIMAPLRVIDYVVVHELAHLKQKNHSKAYWVEVKRLMPDYKEQINWLKANGHTLRL
jgi:predicted metal-dependent hydrolase